MPSKWNRATDWALLCALLAAPATATEWSVGKPVGLSLDPISQGAVAFRSSPWVFVATRSGVLYRKAQPGGSWQAGHWQSLTIDTDTAPAAAVHRGKLHLFTRERQSGKVRSRTFDGASWSDPSGVLGRSSVAPAAVSNGRVIFLLLRTDSGVVAFQPVGSIGQPTNLPGRTTALSPAASFFDRELFVVITRLDGGLSYRTFPSGSWEDLGRIHTTDPPSLAVSRGRLFVFVRDTHGRILYRLLDRSHGRDDWLPVDRWMPAGDGFAESAPTATALNNDLFVYFRRNRVLPGPTGLTRSRPAIYVKTAAWSEVPVAVIRGADPDGTDVASDVNVDNWIRHANSTWSPLLIRFRRAITRIHFGYEWQARDEQGNETWDQYGTNESVLDADSTLDGMVWVVVRARANGGAFAGYPLRYVAMGEEMHVCDENGPTTRPFYNNQLAHEVGHYFGLAHTFHDDPFASTRGVLPATKGIVQAMLEAQGFDPIAALDKDHAVTCVKDTPPDPYYETGQVSPDKCTVAEAPVFFTGKSKGKTCTTNADCVGAETCESGRCRIRLVPPRLNAMSYYQVTATVINKLTSGQSREAYRQLRKRGFAAGDTEAQATP